MSGSDIPDLPDVSQLGTDAPEQSELQQSGKLDSIPQRDWGRGDAVPGGRRDATSPEGRGTAVVGRGAQAGTARTAAGELHTTPYQVPTSLMKAPVPISSVAEMFAQQQKRQG